jgi:hypothetical protein
MLAVRPSVAVPFGSATMVTVPLPEPEAGGVTLAQLALDVAVHSQLACKAAVTVPPPEPTCNAAGEKA